LNEMQTQVESLYVIIREKEQENKILMNQLNSLRKIVKHNQLPPLDTEVARHLEKIKNEESQSFNNELNDILGVNKTRSNQLSRNSNNNDFTAGTNDDIHHGVEGANEPNNNHSYIMEL
jgi:hypothetical protein